jgi:hypothetical protein
VRDDRDSTHVVTKTFIKLWLETLKRGNLEKLRCKCANWTFVAQISSSGLL